MLPSLLSDDSGSGKRAKEKLVDQSLRNYFKTFPEEGQIRKLLRNAYVINRPMLGVGGDGYWMHENDGFIYLIVFDCAGHGRVASIMTRLYVNMIKQVVTKEHLVDPGKILSSIHEKIEVEFKDKENLMVGSGADMLAAKIDIRSNQLEFASARMNLLISRRGQLERIKPIKRERQIGEHFELEHTYTTRSLTWDDTNENYLYLFSDGVTDMIGGPKDRKLGAKGLVEMMEKVQTYDFEQQKPILERKINEWFGLQEPFDDILFLGVML